MTSSKYLYDDLLYDYKDESYEKVLLIKIRLARKLLKRLVIEEDMADSDRINKVIEAEQFNKKLLIELGYTEPMLHKKLKEINEL